MTMSTMTEMSRCQPKRVESKANAVIHLTVYAHGTNGVRYTQGKHGRPIRETTIQSMDRWV